MRITIELRRPARRSVALIVAALLLLTPAVVLANHQFTDVTDTTPFHKEIGAIAKAGITAGFAGNQYRPSEAVTRQAMAAFMERGFGRVGLVAGDEMFPSAFYVPAYAPSVAEEVPAFTVRQLQITVPGASNSYSPNQLVLLHGQVTFRTSMSAEKGCPCTFRAWIRDFAGAGSSWPTQWATFEGTALDGFYTIDVQGLFAAGPAVYTYELMVQIRVRANTTTEATFSLSPSSSLSAMTFPFGPTGSNTVTAPGAQNEPADPDQLPERGRDE